MKILIEAMHGIGDVVCMLPMIKDAVLSKETCYFKERFNAATIYFDFSYADLLFLQKTS